jgi:endoglucanase
MGDDPEGHKAQFLAFWKQLSAHCKGESNSVLFEILNEPNKKLTPELWNQYFREALAIIRETNPTRNVIVGPAFWNSVDHLKELDLPTDDRHLIVTVHYYKPMQFTHQGAAWTGQKDKTGVTWGTEAERKAVQDDFARVTAWAKEHNRPIFLGEFGAYDKGPMDSRVRYTECVARAAEASGWSWAYWQFDSDFILWDMKADKWVEPILHALIPAKQS